MKANVLIKPEDYKKVLQSIVNTYEYQKNVCNITNNIDLC